MSPLTVLAVADQAETEELVEKSWVAERERERDQ